MARGNLAYDQIATGSRQGNGTKLQMFSGSAPTNGHIAAYDASGNLVDGGAAYILPVATSSVLGGVKQGNGTFIDGTGVLTAGIGRTQITAAGTYTMTGAEFFVQAATTGVTIVLPTSPRVGDVYYIGCTTTAITAIIDSGSGNNIFNGLSGPSSQTYTIYTGQCIKLYYVAATAWFIIHYMESDWLNWTPSVTGGGSLTVSAVTITDAQYLVNRNTLFFKYAITLNTGGTSSSNIFVTGPPVSLAGAVSAFAGWTYCGSPPLAEQLSNWVDTTGGARFVNTYPSGFPASATSLELHASGFYRRA